MYYITTRQTTNNANVIIVEANIAVPEILALNSYSVSIAIDYTDIFNKIANSVSIIEQNTTNIKNSLISIDNSLVHINTHIRSIDTTFQSVDTTWKSIDDSWNSIEADIDNLNTRGSNRDLGIYTEGVGNTAFSNEQQRAMVVSALKNSGTLDAFKEEITNPTPLPGD